MRIIDFTHQHKVCQNGGLRTLHTSWGHIKISLMIKFSTKLLCEFDKFQQICVDMSKISVQTENYNIYILFSLNKNK